MRIVVTGSSGFIGSHVVQKAWGLMHDVAPFDIAHGQDVLDRQKLKEVVIGADAVIHCAGLLGTHELFVRPLDAIEVNVAGTVNVLEACLETGSKFVGIEQPRIWHNPYSVTRAAARDLATGWHVHKGLPVTYVRAFNAYGPRQKIGAPQKILPTFANAGWHGAPLPVWGDGSAIVDLVYVTDVAHMLMKAVELPGTDLTLDAGTGTAVTVLEVANRVIEMTGDRSDIEYLPMRLGEDKGRVLPVAMGEGWDLIGWRPEFRWSDVERTVEWYRPK